jgi:hypothetical protein
MVHDPSRNLIYVASDAFSPLHPSSIVTVDTTNASVASFVPVGTDPQPLALSDDGSALWVGLVGERRVRRLTPGPTPVPGSAYSLPTLLTTGEESVPMSLVVLPGAPSSIAVGVHGNGIGYDDGAHGVFILDDGQLRANYVQPPEVIVNYLANGPRGYLLGVGDDNSLAVLRLGTVGATLESHGGLLNAYDPPGFVYAAGAVYATTGEVVDLTNPDAPLPAGYFANIAPDCKPASRSATRLMMFCPSYNGGPNLYIFDTTTFTRVASATLPHAQPNDGSVKFVYLGGDAVALLGNNAPLQIVRAPLIGSQP